MPSTKSAILYILGTFAAGCVIAAAFATNFEVPSGSLEAALDAYSQQSGIQLMVPSDQVRNVHSDGVRGDEAAPDALSRILFGNRICGSSG